MAPLNDDDDIERALDELEAAGLIQHVGPTREGAKVSNLTDGMIDVAISIRITSTAATAAEFAALIARSQRLASDLEQIPGVTVQATFDQLNVEVPDAG